MMCRSSRRSPGVPSPRRAQRPRRRLNRGSFTDTVVRPGAAEETAEELAHARNGRPGRPAWASDVVDAAEVPDTRKAGLAAPGEHHLADPVCAVAASARNRQLTQDNDRLRRQLAHALGRLRAAGQALEPTCDPASARRHQLPTNGGAVPAHGQLAVAAGPLWRAGDLSPPAGIARHLLRSKGRGVWSPAVRQLGAAGWLCSCVATALVRDERPRPRSGEVDVRQF